MILPDETPESPTKSRAGPPSEIPEEDEILPPPAYPGHSSSYQQQHTVDVEAQASHARTPLIQSPSVTPIERGEHARTRFLKAFGVAVLIYLVLVSFTRTIIAGVHWSSSSPHERPGHDKPHGGNGSDHDSGAPMPVPDPSDGKVEQCFSASSAPYTQNTYWTSVHLPLSADVLYIFGRGALTHGSITFAPATDSSTPDGQIRVDIIPHSSSSEAISRTNICLVERAPGQKGVAILTPSTWSPSSDLSFTVNVHFPLPKRGKLHVEAFETDLPLFSHTLSGLEGKVSFGSIQLSTSNMAVHSSFLEAEKACIHTTNAGITGVYRVADLLHLETSNEAISADVTLLHDSKREEPTVLCMHTSNAAITSQISLLSSSVRHMGGVFSVFAQSKNSRQDLRFAEQPPLSTLMLDARTSNSPASVHLHPAYEGAVAVATSSGKLSFELDDEINDPLGRGRTRGSQILQRSARTFSGRVWWGQESDKTPKGDVSVRTENARAALSA